jgi:hypothetical protein
MRRIKSDPSTEETAAGTKDSGKYSSRRLKTLTASRTIATGGGYAKSQLETEIEIGSVGMTERDRSSRKSRVTSLWPRMGKEERKGTR